MRLNCHISNLKEQSVKGMNQINIYPKLKGKTCEKYSQDESC